LERILTCRGFNPPQSLWIGTKRKGPERVLFERATKWHVF
jgi:hypothetical protein